MGSHGTIRGWGNDPRHMNTATHNACNTGPRFKSQPPAEVQASTLQHPDQPHERFPLPAELGALHVPVIVFGLRTHVQTTLLEGLSHLDSTTCNSDGLLVQTAYFRDVVFVDNCVQLIGDSRKTIVFGHSRFCCSLEASILDTTRCILGDDGIVVGTVDRIDVGTVVDTQTSLATNVLK